MAGSSLSNLLVAGTVLLFCQFCLANQKWEPNDPQTLMTRVGLSSPGLDFVLKTPGLDYSFTPKSAYKNWSKYSVLVNLPQGWNHLNAQ